MRKKRLEWIRNLAAALAFAAVFCMGCVLYGVFMSYRAGADLDKVVQARTGLSAFAFMGVFAVLLMTIPVIIAAFEVYYRFSATYIVYGHEKDGKGLFLNEDALSGMINSAARGVEGVTGSRAAVDIFRNSKIGVNLWLDTEGAVDIVKLGGLVRKKAENALEECFHISQFKFFNIYFESAGAGKPKAQSKRPRRAG